MREFRDNLTIFFGGDVFMRISQFELSRVNITNGNETIVETSRSQLSEIPLAALTTVESLHWATLHCCLLDSGEITDLSHVV